LLLLTLSDTTPLRASIVVVAISERLGTAIASLTASQAFRDLCASAGPFPLAHAPSQGLASQ
jgi:hypothetical protein